VDPVSHILLGAGVAYAAFGRTLGRRAAVIGALAGLAPDADVFIGSSSDPLLEIEFHRHFTHSVFFAPIGAAIVSMVWIARKKFREQWSAIGGAALLAYLSHCFLDASTTYGTQLLWPFSSHRFGWDLVSIIDPIFTLALLLGLTIGLLRRRTAVVIAGLIFCAGYLGAGAIQKHRALHAQANLAEQRGHAVERTAAMPTLGNNVVWRSLYLHDGRIYSDRIRVGWFSAPRFREGASLPQITADDLTDAELERDRERPVFGRFAWFSDHWVARSPSDERVLADMRYSLSAEAFDPIWGIRFAESGQSPHVEWVNRTRERELELGSLWREIRGSDSTYRLVATAGFSE
jgi:inner membrane protein